MTVNIYQATGFALLLATAQSFGAEVQGLDPVDSVLTRVWRCSESVTLRSQSLARESELKACKSLAEVEERYHATFGTVGKPVKDDSNESLRANIYRSKDDFRKYAGSHFNMPTDNGGMYLEGLPEKTGNQAEFVANERPDGTVHNLEHEFVHFLDGRFNLHGDFCMNLHDSHAPPENCPKPAPLTPYLVWWTEGIAEYISRGADHPKAAEIAATNEFKLSELFDTGYEKNTSRNRVYTWGYLAVRFMMENHRAEIDNMLHFTRAGDYPRYQAAVREWGRKFDGEFAEWLVKTSSGSTNR